MFQFLKNLYFSQVARKITCIFKVTITSSYTTRVRHVLSHHWLLVYHGSEIRGNGVHSGLHGSGVHGSPCVN